MERIEVQQNIYDANDRISAETNRSLSARGLFAVNVMGAPGAGKTSVVLGLAERLGLRCYAIEGDIEADFDTRTLRARGIETVQINTHGECHLDAPQVRDAVAGLDAAEPGVLFIENIGNLVCPAEFTIGEHLRMLVVTATDGSDKPYKYPLAFEKADVIVLNKTDLLPYVDFDEPFFMAGVRAQNADVPVFKVSARNGSGLDGFAQWMADRVKTSKA